MPIVTIDGKELNLSDEIAGVIAPIIAKRDADAASAAEAAKTLGEERAKAAADKARHEEAKRKAEQDLLIKNGEASKALEISEARTGRIAARYAGDAAMALLRPLLREGLTAAEMSDIYAAVSAGVTFDLAAEKLTAKDGSDAKAFVEKWIGDRPNLKAAPPATGSGAGNNSPPSGGQFQRRSLMTDQQRLHAIKTLGREAYLALPS